MASNGLKSTCRRGSTLDRPGIALALEMLARGDVDALLVAKSDRLSRSLIDFNDLLKTAEREAWSLVILDLGVDTTTPAAEARPSVARHTPLKRRVLVVERRVERRL